MSTLCLQRGLSGFKAAWTLLHKLLMSMVRPGRDLLTGEVDIDETCVGDQEEGKLDREINKKSIVVTAAEKNDRAIRRIRMKRVMDVPAESLLAFIRGCGAWHGNLHELIA